MKIVNRLLCAALLATVFTGTAEADRRTGMRRSLLIDDQDDIFLFPNALVNYGNRISLDYGGDETSGNAVMSLGGDSSAFAFALHRGDVLDPHGRGVALFGAMGDEILGDLPSLNVDQSPATMIDFMYSRRAGANMDWGFRLGLGRGANVTTVAGTDSGTEELFVNAQIGLGNGRRGQGARYDVGLSFGLGLANTVANGNDVQSASRLNVDGLARVYLPMDSQLDLGILGSAGVRAIGFTDQVAPNTPTNGTLNAHLAVGAGPSLRLNGASIAGYALIRGQMTAQDPNSEADDDETGRVLLVIPGLHVAVEVPVTDWFYVRSGAEYGFAVLADSEIGDDNGTSSNTGAFGWNAGLGVKVDNFRFDGSLSHGFVTGGPDFIGGTGGGFLGMASLTYSFDDARGSATPVSATEDEQTGVPDFAAEPLDVAPANGAPVPAPEPAPAVEPVPATEPVPAQLPAPASIQPVPAPASIQPVPVPASVQPVPAPAAGVQVQGTVGGSTAP